MTDLGSAPTMNLSDARASRYSYWRVWAGDDEVRVARDDHESPPPGPGLQPQHLAYHDGRIVWKRHDQGGEIAAVRLSDFVAWLDQRGHVE